MASPVKRERPKTALPSTTPLSTRFGELSKYSDDLATQRSRTSSGSLSGRYSTSSLSSSTSNRRIRPSTAPLQRILGHHSAQSHARSHRVKSALTQVHEGIGTMASSKTELRRYLAKPKSRRRKPARDMTQNPFVDWNRLLMESQGVHMASSDAAQENNGSVRKDLNELQSSREEFVENLVAILVQFVSINVRAAARSAGNFTALKRLDGQNKEAETKAKMQSKLDADAIALRRVMLKRGGGSAFEDQNIKINSDGVWLIEAEVVQAQNEQNRYDLGKLQSKISMVMESTGRARVLKNKRLRAAKVAKLRKNANKANNMFSGLDNTLNTDWFWTIPVAALQMADMRAIQGHRNLLLSLRGGQDADAVFLMYDERYDSSTKVPMKVLENIEYELLVEDPETSCIVADIWLSFLVEHGEKATAQHIVSRRSVSRMVHQLREKNLKKVEPNETPLGNGGREQKVETLLSKGRKQISSMWKIVSASRAYRKILFKNGSHRSIYRVGRSAKIKELNAKKRFARQMQASRRWKGGRR